MGMSRQMLWGLLGNLTVVEPVLLSAYENEERKIWREGIGDSPHGSPWFTSFHGSSFPGDDDSVCGRAQVYGLMNPAPEKPLDPKTRAIFDVGTQHEHNWVKRLSAYGVLLSADVTGEDEYQTGFTDPDVWLTGSPDVIMLPPFWSKSHVAEIKTTCLTGSTLVAVADGRNAVSIRQLSEEGKDVDVYSSSNGNTVVKKMRNIHKTKVNTAIVKVNLDDGSYIRCTPDHKFFLLDRTYCRADELKSGASLMRFDSRVFPHDRTIRRSIWMGPRGTGNRWQLQYKMSGKRIFNNYVKGSGLMVHHIDENPLNDNYNNLQLIDRKGHATLHNKNPERRKLVSEANIDFWESMTKEERSARGFKIAASRDQDKTNEKLRKTFQERGPEWRRERALKARANDTVENKALRSKKLWDGIRKRDEEIYIPGPDIRKQLREESGLTQKQLARLVEVGVATVGRWERGEFPPTGKTRIKYKEVLDRLVSEPVNHKVVSVECDGYEDTYCGTVNGTNNFSIITTGSDFEKDDLSGVVVSNSHEKVQNMIADPTSTPYSHSKYLRQIKTYIGEAHEQGFSPTVIVCSKSGVMIKNGKDKCAVAHSGACAPKILKVEPPDDGTLIYSSREEPFCVASYYVAYNKEFMESGKEKLKVWKTYFENDEIPPHVREGESAKWSVGQCQYCPEKKRCKIDYKDKKKYLSDSEVGVFTKTVRPWYNYIDARATVFRRWGLDDPSEKQVRDRTGMGRS